MNFSITTHIAELLHLYNCIILPDFGAFIANYQSARIEKDKNTIRPPAKEIIFNANLKHNDGLLLHHIANSEKISYEEAYSALGLFIKETNHKLSKGERVLFEQIGSFIFDQKFNLIFEPAHTKNYLLDSFGFNELKLPTSIQGTYFDTSQTIYMDQSNKRRIILRAAAVTIPVILAISAIQFRSKIFKNDQMNYSSLNPVEQVAEKETIHDKTIVVDTAKVELVVDEMTKPKNALFYNEEEPKEEVKPIGKGSYYLIAGSFTDTMHANRLREMLLQQGYNHAEVLSTTDGKYRVSFNVYADKFQALQELTRIRKEKNDDSVWLWTKK